MIFRGDFIAGFLISWVQRPRSITLGFLALSYSAAFVPSVGWRRSKPLRRGPMKNSRSRGYQFLLVALTLIFGLLANAQTYTDLHDFNETNGCCALAPSLMAQGRDGDIYGATTSGGIHFYGNIFKITPTGTLTSIHDFDLTHGGYPQGGLSMGLDGNFYGTTYQGGKGYGIVFQITPSGTFTESMTSPIRQTEPIPGLPPCRPRTETSMAPLTTAP